jgi:hypothetical protein
MAYMCVAIPDGPAAPGTPPMFLPFPGGAKPPPPESVSQITGFGDMCVVGTYNLLV